VNERPESEDPRPSVLAIGVTPLQATQAYEALLEVSGEGDLRAPDDQATRDRYSSHADRFRFVGLDPLDPIESQLLVSDAVYAEQVDELLSRSPETSRFIDPFSVIVVVVPALDTEPADATPGGASRGPFERAFRRFRRSPFRPAERSSALARLLDGLGHAYGGGSPGPVLLNLTDARITLVAEPGLPAGAIRFAEQLVGIRGQDTSQLPLRWNAKLDQWVPLLAAWSDQAALRRLATEIQAKLPPPPPARSPWP
jgi:hypothetical protein